MSIDYLNAVWRHASAKPSWAVQGRRMKRRASCASERTRGWKSATIDDGHAAARLLLRRGVVKAERLLGQLIGQVGRGHVPADRCM